MTLLICILALLISMILIPIALIFWFKYACLLAVVFVVAALVSLL